MSEQKGEAGEVNESGGYQLLEIGCSADDEEYRRLRAGFLQRTREIHEFERGRLRERPGLDLAPVSEVLRARWRETFRRELLALTAANVSDAMAESLARAQADALIPQLVRRLAAEVWCGSLPGYVIADGARLAISVRGDEYRFVMPGVFQEVKPTIDHALFDALDVARTKGPAVLAEAVLNQPTTPDGRPIRNTFLGGFSDDLHIRADWPSEEPAARPAWPWGEYTTPQLEVLAEVAAQLWERWEGRAAEAKVDADVESLLRDGYFGKTLAPGGVKVPPGIAKAIAVLLRPPGMPTGRKGPEDARDFRWRRGDSIPSGWES